MVSGPGQHLACSDTAGDANAAAVDGVGNTSGGPGFSGPLTASTSNLVTCSIDQFQRTI